MDINQGKKLNKAHHGISLRPVQFIFLGFLAFILVGSFLLVIPWANSDGEWGNYMTSLFTSTSAVCVTGLTTTDIATSFTVFGQIVILFLIQFGGLGFMTIATLLFMVIGKKITLKDRMALAEAYNQEELQGMVRLTRLIILCTFIIEISGALFLSFSFIPKFGWGRGIYYSIFHAISAFCNAGIDLMGVLSPGVGFAPFLTDVICNLGIIFLIILGGLGFTVMRDIIAQKGKFSKFRFHTKAVLIVTGALLLIGVIGFLGLEWNNPKTLGNLNFFEKLMASFFQAVTPRTAGFSTVGQGDLTRGGRVLTSILMFIGASPASTGGGIKTTTMFVLILTFICGIKGNEQVTCFGRSVHRRNIIRSVALVLFAFMIVFLATFIISIIEVDCLKKDIDLEMISFECISAFATVGLSMGITAQLSAASHAILIIAMLLGRLGTLSLGLFAFTKRETLNLKYPDAKILIG